MKKFSVVLCTAAAVIGLSGCVRYAGGPYDRYDGYGPYDRYDGYYGNNYGNDYYDGYYDGYYGPYVGGYWANDGYFYYSDRQHNYRRDGGRHFRHERFNGGTRFHGEHHGDGTRSDRHDDDDHDQDRD